mgnify:CR=1 FL=1
MTIHADPSKISSSEWLSLNQFLQELKEINTQCISVYYPYGKGQDTIQLLQETNRSELLEKIENINNVIPYGDRSNSVIEPLLTEQWFADAEKLSVKAKEVVNSKMYSDYFYCIDSNQKLLRMLLHR